MKNKRSQYLYVVAIIISIVVMSGCTPTSTSTPTPTSISIYPSTPTVLTAESTPTEAPSTPIAVYIPQPAETPVTPIMGTTQVSCDGKLFDMWGLPGTYLYKRTTDDGDVFLTIERKLGDDIPSFDGGGRPPGSISTTVVGVEEKTIDLGTFQAVRVNTIQEYHILTGRLDNLAGLYKTSEWYVCEYGLIYATTSHAGTNNGRNFQSKSQLVLVSFTPISTNESHVRYILVDIQLGHVADYYRANTTDEETAEALRRWDAGLRVINIERFERRVVNGQWQIVYSRTENPVNGMDVNLTSDPKQ